MPRKTVEIIARGVLIRNDHLLLCRSRRHGHAFLPGGHVEFGETAKHALQRELREELGLEVEIGAFIGAMEASFEQTDADEHSTGAAKPTQATRRHHEINLVFAMESKTISNQTIPHAIQSREDHIEFIWMLLEDHPDDPAKLTILPPGIERLVRTGHSTDAAIDQRAWQSNWE